MQQVTLAARCQGVFAGTMIFTEETTDDGELSVYATNHASVVSYFTDDSEVGTVLHVEPTEFACPWTTRGAKLDSVRDAVIAEAARRLACFPDQVLLHGMDAIAALSGQERADGYNELPPESTGAAVGI